MFKSIKQAFILLQSFNQSSAAKCVFLNDKSFKTTTNLFDLNQN